MYFYVLLQYSSTAVRAHSYIRNIYFEQGSNLMLVPTTNYEQAKLVARVAPATEPNFLGQTFF